MALGIDAEVLHKAGTIDVTLDSDTRLFIDPLLLADAADRDFSRCATEAYRERFDILIKVLSRSTRVNDVAWRNAERLLKFHEVHETHLGYSGGKSGSGFGTFLSGNLLATAKEIIDLGVTDPDLFMVLALLEDGVGADRISDMTTNVILPCLADFTQRIAGVIGIPLERFSIHQTEFDLIVNPVDPSKGVLLVPKDIVKDLPVASDWDSVAAAAQATQDLRDRVNNHIGEIWRARSKKDRALVKQAVLRSKESFDLILGLLHDAAEEAYDTKADHNGEIYPANLRRSIAESEPINFSKFSGKKLTLDQVDSIAVMIIEKFRELVEDKGLWRELWDDAGTKPRREKAAQRIFYAVACAYCEANDLDISPESDAGAGPVDFKFSGGAKSKVLVELKRDTNSKLVPAYRTQLDAYRSAESANRAHYLVLDQGWLTPTKFDALKEARQQCLEEGLSPSEIVVIDARTQLSASKR